MFHRRITCIDPTYTGLDGPGLAELDWIELDGLG